MPPVARPFTLPWCLFRPDFVLFFRSDFICMKILGVRVHIMWFASVPAPGHLPHKSPPLWRKKLERWLFFSLVYLGLNSYFEWPWATCLRLFSTNNTYFFHSLVIGFIRLVFSHFFCHIQVFHKLQFIPVLSKFYAFRKIFCERNLTSSCTRNQSLAPLRPPQTCRT